MAEWVTTEGTHILTVESIIEAEVLLTTEKSTSWILDSGASYHMTLFRSQFHSYTALPKAPAPCGIVASPATILHAITARSPGTSTLIVKLLM